MTYNKKGFFVRLLYLQISLIYYFLIKIKIIDIYGVIVLCYHGISFSKKFNFANQIKKINKNIISTAQLASKIKSNKSSLCICLTFDDAFANIEKNVIPIISYFQLPITIFIPTGSIGNAPSWLRGSSHPDSKELVLSIDQITKLNNNSLVTFGSHTVDHLRLSRLENTDIRKQISKSRYDIKEIIEKNVVELALPHGDYNETVLQIAVEEGFRQIYTLEPKINDFEHHEQMQIIGRFSVSPDDWPIEFYLTVKGAYSWLAPWRRFFHRFHR